MKGIEFLKKIGRVEEGLITEAAAPIKKSKKWNGNMIKFVSLAACIAVFVGAICVGRAGAYLKKNNNPISNKGNVPDNTTLEESSNNSENMEPIEVSQGSEPDQSETASIRMVMLEGKIYVDVGKSDINARCGMMDGSIDSSVESGKYPERHNQSNFGSGYGYQYVGDNSIDVNINGEWIRFEVFIDITEEPFTTEPLNNIVGSGKEGETVRPARIEASLKTDSITADGAEFVIMNLGYKNATTGMDFRIEKLENGNWMECDYINDPPSWNEMALILESDKETVFRADWSTIYGSLEKGTYRFRKNINIENGYGEEIFCEFTL